MREAMALVLIFATFTAHAQPAAESLRFTPDEMTRVRWHGPWPPAKRRAPRPAAAALGEKLFFDPRLSGTGSVLCASCHVPYRAFQDGRALAFGLEESNRNTLSVLNVGYFRRFGWDGGRASLAAQSLRPLLEPKEMRSSAAQVAQVLRAIYASQYAAALGSPKGKDDETLFADAAAALAAYQETLVSGRTPFDEFRDALAGADSAGAEGYPLAAQRGLKRFVARCSACHSGALFSDSAIVRGVRVPSLRNVALTAPYMHDGSIASLAQAVRHIGGVSDADAADLVEFLKTLSATGASK